MDFHPLCGQNPICGRIFGKWKIHESSDALYFMGSLQKYFRTLPENRKTLRKPTLMIDPEKLKNIICFVVCRLDLRIIISYFFKYSDLLVGPSIFCKARNQTNKQIYILLINFRNFLWTFLIVSKHFIRRLLNRLVSDSVQKCFACEVSNPAASQFDQYNKI